MGIEQEVFLKNPVEARKRSEKGMFVIVANEVRSCCPMLTPIVGAEASESFMRGHGVGWKGYEWGRQLNLALGSHLFAAFSFVNKWVCIFSFGESHTI